MHEGLPCLPVPVDDVRTQDRVQQVTHLDVLAAEVFADGIDDEGAVGHRRLHDGARRLPAVDGERRRERAHARRWILLEEEAVRADDERDRLLVAELGEVLAPVLREERRRETLERRGGPGELGAHETEHPCQPSGTLGFGELDHGASGDERIGEGAAAGRAALDLHLETATTARARACSSGF